MKLKYVFPILLFFTYLANNAWIGLGHCITAYKARMILNPNTEQSKKVVIEFIVPTGPETQTKLDRAAVAVECKKRGYNSIQFLAIEKKTYYIQAGSTYPEKKWNT